MENNIIYYVATFVISLFRYFFVAGIAFVIFYKLFPKKFSKNKIQVKLAKKKDFIREILYSLQTTFIFAGIGILMLKTPLKSYTLIYVDLSAYSLYWIPVSVLLALIIQDTYFYWMHRSVHHPKLFKHIHLLHHQSINPSPWTSYSFHFLESILEALIAPIVFMLLPMHIIAIILFVFASFAINVYGHLGYEIAPKWFRTSFLFEILNTSTYHNIHHSKFKGNYGLYFRVWDRVMKTEHPDYVKNYDMIQKRRFETTEKNTHKLKKFSLLALLISLIFLTISAKAPERIIGIWKDHISGVTIKIYENNGLYFGQLIKADNPEENKRIIEHGNVVLMKNFEKNNSKEYCCGTIFLIKKNKTIDATLILEDDNTLKINGKYGMFTGSRIWKRITL